MKKAKTVWLVYAAIWKHILILEKETLNSLSLLTTKKRCSEINGVCPPHSFRSQEFILPLSRTVECDLLCWWAVSRKSVKGSHCTAIISVTIISYHNSLYPAGVYGWVLLTHAHVPEGGQNMNFTWTQRSSCSWMLPARDLARWAGNKSSLL